MRSACVLKVISFCFVDNLRNSFTADTHVNTRLSRIYNLPFFFDSKTFLLHSSEPEFTFASIEFSNILQYWKKTTNLPFAGVKLKE